MINTALWMIMIALFGGYIVLRIGQSYLFFTHPIFCVLVAAGFTALFHWAGELTHNEDLYFLVSIALMLVWFGRVNYRKPLKRAEDVFEFTEIAE